MTLKDNEEIEATPLEIDHEEDGSSEGEHLIVDPMERDVLVIRRALHAKVNEVDDKRENIFQSLCVVKGKICSLIIDSEICTNIAATTLVEKLGLPTTAHPSQYKL
ncbi:hypothetical protein CFOL_v3_04869 [Cephalotus follicularis]|uniref:Asp_protease_2 domain-containing protein n=1 Tax=Cephalotus follicularis TaxID=3775 RepID=A0A1Q3B0N1_CEPFO|nr:hypothetical protein CFOL_v3_04869 [Cephalotus follicularis]